MSGTISSSDETPVLDAFAESLRELSSAELDPVEETLAVLHHDVGKYITRVSRNVARGAPVPSPLGAMLLKDLYETHQGTRASARFAELVAVLPAALAEQPPVRDAARALQRIDDAETAVRALDPVAVARVLEDAREVELHLSMALRKVRLARVRVDGAEG